MSQFTRYLLDTNVISESRRSNADPRVSWFFRNVSARNLHISALTIGELCKGVEMLKRKKSYRVREYWIWVNDLEHSFGERVLPVDQAIARLWGELSSDRSRPAIDTLVAATAIANDLVLVTRNVRDLRGIKLEMINPWDESTYQ